jgi:hypothetical protein
VGLTQADALKSYLGEHPEFSEEFIEVMLESAEKIVGKDE